MRIGRAVLRGHGGGMITKEEELMIRVCVCVYICEIR